MRCCMFHNVVLGVCAMHSQRAAPAEAQSARVRSYCVLVLLSIPAFQAV